MMDFFKAAVPLVVGLAWPILILIIVSIFRKELAQFIGAVRRVKGPGVDLEIGSAARVIRDELEATPLPSVVVPEEIAVETQTLDPQSNAAEIVEPRVAMPQSASINRADEDERFDTVAAISPVAAIVSAWQDLEREIERLAKHSYPPIPGDAKDRVRELHARGQLDEGSLQATLDLDYLRKRAEHGSAADLTPIEARDFRRTVEATTARMKKVSGSGGFTQTLRMRADRKALESSIVQYSNAAGMRFEIHERPDGDFDVVVTCSYWQLGAGRVTGIADQIGGVGIVINRGPVEPI